MTPNSLLPGLPGKNLVRVTDWLESAAKRSLMADTAGERDFQETRLALQVLLAHIAGMPRAWVIAHPEAALTEAQTAELNRLLERFVHGTPLPYLLGRWEFYGRLFTITPATLIPRPETELLVETAETWLRAHPNQRQAADVGTGSGCIAISLARQIPDLRMLAIDLSMEALQVAQQNTQDHLTSSQIQFVQGNLLQAVSGPFDLVCANLPYIPSATLAELPVAKSEPQSALDGGMDGLTAIRALVEDAPRWLAQGGLLLLEMQYDQGEAISAILRERLGDVKIKIVHDLAGLPRLVQAERG